MVRVDVGVQRCGGVLVEHSGFINDKHRVFVHAPRFRLRLPLGGQHPTAGVFVNVRTGTVQQGVHAVAVGAEHVAGL